MSSDLHRSIDIPMGKMYRLGGGAEYKKRNDLTIGGAVDILYEGDLSVDVKSDGGRVSGKYEKVLRESTEFQTFIDRSREDN